MKCDNCPAAWESGGMTSCGYECDSYGCTIRGMYYGGEGESCYLTKAQVERRLQEWEDYTAGKIDRPEWVVKKFMRDLDYQMRYECGLPGYPPKRMYDGCHKHIQGMTDMHYQMRADYRKGYEDAKAGKPFDNEYESGDRSGGRNMSKWIYDGYTKVKIGSGRHARYVENHIYKCKVCGWSIRVERTEKPPQYCPSCMADMNEDTPDE